MREPPRQDQGPSKCQEDLLSLYSVPHVRTQGEKGPSASRGGSLLEPSPIASLASDFQSLELCDTVSAVHTPPAVCGISFWQLKTVGYRRGDPFASRFPNRCSEV